MSVHLLSILQQRGVALAVAVGLGALVGPSQVGARAIEMVIGHYHHPIWTLVASTVLVAVGIGQLAAGLPVVAVGLRSTGPGSASNRLPGAPCPWPCSEPPATPRSWAGWLCPAFLPKLPLPFSGHS